MKFPNASWNHTVKQTKQCYVFHAKLLLLSSRISEISRYSCNKLFSRNFPKSDTVGVIVREDTSTVRCNQSRQWSCYRFTHIICPRRKNQLSSRHTSIWSRVPQISSLFLPLLSRQCPPQRDSPSPTLLPTCQLIFNVTKPRPFTHLADNLYG